MSLPSLIVLILLSKAQRRAQATVIFSALANSGTERRTDGCLFLGLAFVAIGWSVRARAAAGLVQGFAMAGVGIGAIVQIVHRILKGGAPSLALIGGVAVLALTVNGYCAYRLILFRGCFDASNLAVDAK